MQHILEFSYLHCCSDCFQGHVSIAEKHTVLVSPSLHYVFLNNLSPNTKLLYDVYLITWVFVIQVLF